MNRPAARGPRAVDEDWLAAALSEQAGEHEPDHGRIHARAEQLIAEQHRRTGRSRPQRRRVPGARRSGPARLRLAAVPLGILAGLMSATVAVAVSLGLGAHGPARSSGPAAGLTGSAGPALATTAPATPPSVLAHPAGTTTARSDSPTTAPPPTGPLTVSSAVDSHITQYWSQESVTVTTTHALGALHVTVSVSGAASVQSTGMWSTLVATTADSSVHQTSNGLVYDVTLKTGQTLTAGTYTFGFQFNHPANGHSFTADTYHVSAVIIDGGSSATATATVTAVGAF